ncbi:MAG TPA: hypothetical protein VM939_13345 [Gemmatimonadaceae bacterium]|nr:hypothetical protein [Gemmatimonadaceae bacterium]
MKVSFVSIALVVSAAFVTPVIASGQAAGDSGWTIKSGRFADAWVPIQSGKATGRGASRFWRETSRRQPRRLVGWGPSRFPIAVAFRHTGESITELDSAAFWKILSTLESDFGMKLFRPVTLEKDQDPDDVIVIEAKGAGGADGLTLITWTESGEVYDARIRFRSRTLLANSRVVTHEMMHALGFGHTSAWPSIMSPGMSGIDRLTATDVAHAQYALHSRGAAESELIWERLALAMERDPAVNRRETPAECGATDHLGRQLLPDKNVDSGWLPATAFNSCSSPQPMR